MYYLEYCYERNSELETDEYAYYVLHYVGKRGDDNVYDGERYVVLKVSELS